MADRTNPAVIIRYLLDLDDIRTEHDKPGQSCPDCSNRRQTGNTGPCWYISTITVEIVTNQRKLLQIARIV